MLSFGNPAGFIALLALPVILAIHFLQRESRRVLTSTLFLLEQLAPESAQGRRFERLRNSVPLWLQILAALLVTWLLVQPRWLRRDSTQHVVIVLDSSVSMLAFHDELLRALETHTAQLARAAAKTEWQLLESDTTRPTLYSGLDQSALLAAARKWKPHLGTHDFNAALQAGQMLLRGTGTLIFATDRPSALPAGVRLLAVGRPLENCGFAGSNFSGREWKALVRNYGRSTQQRTWWIEAKGTRSPAREIALEPGQSIALTGSLPKGANECELILSGDAFPLDDHLPIVLPQPKRLQIAKQADSPFADFFAQFTASLEALENGSGKPDLQLTVYDPFAPRLPETNAIVFVADATPSTKFLPGNVVAENHPLTAELNWSGLLVRQTLSVAAKPGDQTLVWQGERPLIFLRGSVLVINFDLRAANATRLPAFVLLLTRFVEEIRAQKIGFEACNVDTNQLLSVAGDSAGSFRAPSEPHFFEVMNEGTILLRAAAQFADAREADFREAASANDLANTTAQLRERNSERDFLAPVWALALGLVMLGSWSWRQSLIRFASPSWLVFLPLLLALVVWRREFRTPLRLGCLALLLLVLLEPQIRRLGKGLDLWVLVDRSASAADALVPRLSEMQSLLTRSKSADDRLSYVDYAELAQIRNEADEIPPHKQQQTRTALAIEFALSRMSNDRASRLLLLTDGYSTEPLAQIGERLKRQSVALDYRLIAPTGLVDYRIERLELPPRAQTGEPFLIEVDVAGEPDGEVSLGIERDGASIGNAQLQLHNGKAHARFTDRLVGSGAHRYTARLSAASDARPGNNRAEKWIEITGGPRLLLVTTYADDPLIAALSAQGFTVETVSDPAKAHIGQLAGAKTVILNNVPAYRLPSEFLSALDFYVRGQGGGLLMTGGKLSYAAGGYFDSAIDELLPVSMELRTEHRKLAVAMAIVLDRSGSMSASVAGNLQKMDLANEGAARAIDLLGSMDAVSVFAVDTQAHEVVPLTSLGANRESLTSTVRRITSGGGGICVPTGLRAARAQLLKATAGQRHILVFADANDATQELGDWAALLREMAKEGITVSVIALGNDKDSGAKFLRDVADLGKGRIFFNENPTELPALFAQETVAVARSAFIDEPVPVSPTAGWLELAAKPLAWLKEVDGYNLSYLKPEATAAAFSGDEYKAPLVSYWQRGAGRVAAVSFPLGGEFSGRVRAWEHYGDFAQTLVRWLAGEQPPPGLGLRTHLDGTALRLDLFYDASWEQKLAQAAPRIMLGQGASGETRELVWNRIEPGHYVATTTLDPERWVRGAVQVENYTFPFGPLIAGTNEEWKTDRARLLELEAVAHASGGMERVDLAKIWRAPRRSAFRDVQTWLLSALLVLFVMDAFLARRGWQRPMPAPAP